jgi:hypothetical protein
MVTVHRLGPWRGRVNALYGFVLAGAGTALWIRAAEIPRSAWLADPALQLGVLCLVFFYISYEAISKAATITRTAIMYDVGEIVIMLMAFQSVSLVPPLIDAAPTGFAAGCFWVAVAVIAQLFWRLSLGLPVENAHVMFRVITYDLLLAAVRFENLMAVRSLCVLGVILLTVIYVWKWRGPIP